MGRTSDARQRLIESAMELVHARSYTSVGVNELCQHAGVKKGSFYHFFPTKQDLTLAAIDGFAEIFFRDFAGLTLDSELPALERVQKIFQALYQYHKSITDSTGYMRGCPFGNMAVELSTQDEVIRNKVQEIFERIASGLDAILADGVTCGELPPLDTHRTARSVLAYIEGVLLLAKTWNDPQIILDLAQQLPQLITPRSS